MLNMVNSDYWESLSVEEKLKQMSEIRDKLYKQRNELREDCLTMALRLYGEDWKTFAPETLMVMSKWKERVEAILNSGNREQ